MQPNTSTTANAAPLREERPLRLKIADAVKDAILQDIPEGKDMQVMDYGCGTGLVSLALAPGFANVTAVETSERQLTVLDEKIAAARIDNVTTCCFDMERQPWQGGRFHLIVVSMTLHHIEDIDRVLGHFAEALLPGGCLAIADLDTEEGDFHDGRPGVAHNGFDREALQTALKRAGLTPVGCRTIHVVKKPIPDGDCKEYPMFFIRGQKIAMG